MNFIKSPFNYMGNKYKQLPQLTKLYPKEINNFLDLFCGGCDVSINVNANNIFANDSNIHLIQILKEFQRVSLEDIIALIQKRIEEFNLSNTNIDGYNLYRDYYNTNINYHTPLDLFILSRYSYCNIIRFNKSGQMNASIIKNRNGFNSRQEKNLIQFYPLVQKINFSSQDFREINLNQFDFIYADPPYFNSSAVYNTSGYCGETWSINDDLALLHILEKFKNNFMLSNFLKHKDNFNNLLYEWANDNKFNIYVIKSNYDSCFYSRKQYEDETIEVAITNY